MRKGLVIAALLSALGTPQYLLAATNTDSVNKYAWGDRLGWVNFGVSSGNLEVTATAVTGYAWNENYGWINMNPAGSGVLNSGGDLSGSAWGENIGYLDFGGVTISASGVFSGTASSTNGFGTLSFDCANCSVETSWRPQGPVTSSDSVTVPGNSYVPPPDGTNQSTSTASTSVPTPPAGDDAWIKELLVMIQKLQAEIRILQGGATANEENCPPLGRDLKIGMNGEDVRALQRFLNTRSFTVALTGPGAKGQETSLFREKTLEAVRKFQSAHSIAPAAGYVGPITRAKIEELCSQS